MDNLNTADKISQPLNFDSIKQEITEQETKEHASKKPSDPNSFF